MKRSGLTLIVLAACIGCRDSAPPPLAEGGSPRAALPSSTQPTTHEAVYRRDLPKAISEGVAFLITSQNPDGSWGTGTVTRGTEVYSMVPGSHDAYRVAVTALCAMALREFGEREAHDRAVEYLVTAGYARRDDGDLLYNIWAHTYALQALVGEMVHNGNIDPRAREMAQWHLERLARYETYMGGWNYYDFVAGTQRPSMGPTSFGTAAGLVALHEARNAGIDVPQGMIDRATRRLEEMRLPTGAYLYSHDLRYRPQASANRPRGSIGRNQACNFALLTCQSPKVTRAQAAFGLEEFFREHDYIAMGRKRPYPHESWYATAPYYYYFGHYYAARLIELLGEEGLSFKSQLAEQVLPFQEPDGSWWDYAMWDYHKPYGTAFALMTLMRCR